MIKPFYEERGVTIYHGDCREVMLELPQVDLVITSPPYNVGIEYGNGKSDYLDVIDYRNFACEFFSALRLCIKPETRVCVELGGSGESNRMSWVWQDAAYSQRFHLFSEIVMDHRKSNPCAWGSYLRSDNVFTIPNFHLLYVFYNETRTKRGATCDVTKDEWMEWTRGRWGSVHYGKHNGHPAPFAETIPVRCMKLFGHIEDVVWIHSWGAGRH